MIRKKMYLCRRKNRGVAQLVVYLVWDQVVARSSRVTPTHERLLEIFSESLFSARCGRENRSIADTKKSNLLKFNKLLFVCVIPAGFKPATPTSVVWYSIQLSYGTSKYCFGFATAKVRFFLKPAK